MKNQIADFLKWKVRPYHPAALCREQDVQMLTHLEFSPSLPAGSSGNKPRNSASRPL